VVEGVVGGDPVLDAAHGEGGDVARVMRDQALVVGLGEAAGGASRGGAVQLGGGGEGFARELEVEGEGLVGPSASRSPATLAATDGHGGGASTTGRDLLLDHA
jgi:hypothetical protein